MADSSAIIDAVGLLCPLPVLRLRKRLMALPAGAEVTLIADDPAAAVDVPHFCAESGHQLLHQAVEGGVRRFVVKSAVSGDGS